MSSNQGIIHLRISLILCHLSLKYILSTKSYVLNVDRRDCAQKPYMILLGGPPRETGTERARDGPPELLL